MSRCWHFRTLLPSYQVLNYFCLHPFYILTYTVSENNNMHTGNVENRAVLCSPRTWMLQFWTGCRNVPTSTVCIIIMEVFLITVLVWWMNTMIKATYKERYLTVILITVSEGYSMTIMVVSREGWCWSCNWELYILINSVRGERERERNRERERERSGILFSFLLFVFSRQGLEWAFYIISPLPVAHMPPKGYTFQLFLSVPVPGDNMFKYKCSHTFLWAIRSQKFVTNLLLIMKAHP